MADFYCNPPNFGGCTVPTRCPSDLVHQSQGNRLHYRTVGQGACCSCCLPLPIGVTSTYQGESQEMKNKQTKTSKKITFPQQLAYEIYFSTFSPKKYFLIAAVVQRKRKGSSCGGAIAECSIAFPLLCEGRTHCTASTPTSLQNHSHASGRAVLKSSL